jgi:hypothetical protein
MSRLRSATGVAALMLLALGLVIGHVHSYTEVSPIDELQHLDYLIRAGDGHLVGLGDLFSQQSLRLETCHRLDAEFDAKVPPCVTDSNFRLDPAIFQESGFNTAAIHPPTYYVIDGFLARGIAETLPVKDDPLTNGRVAGAVWLMAAVGALWLLLRELGANRILASALIAIAISAPTVLFAAATINTDGTSLLCGALLVWAVVRWERGRLPLWVVLAATALCAGTKVTNLIGVAVVVLYLLIRCNWSSIRATSTDTSTGAGTAGRSDRNLRSSRLGVIGRMKEFCWSNRRRLLPIIWTSLVAVGVSGIWQVVAQSIATVPGAAIPMTQRYTVTSFPMSQFIGSWRQTFDPLFGPYLPPFLRTDLVTLTSGLTAVLLVLLTIVAMVRSPKGSRPRALACASLGAAAIAGPAIVLFNFGFQSVYVDIPFRYALVAVPALVASAAAVLHGRWSTALAAGFAVISVASVGIAFG